METKKKLSLNKETIVSLNSETMYNTQGGGEAWGVCRATKNCGEHTGGCTDGCGSVYHCTDSHYTRTCTGGSTEPCEKEKTSGNGPQ